MDVIRYPGWMHLQVQPTEQLTVGGKSMEPPSMQTTRYRIIRQHAGYGQHMYVWLHMANRAQREHSGACICKNEKNA